MARGGSSKRGHQARPKAGPERRRRVARSKRRTEMRQPGRGRWSAVLDAQGVGRAL